MIARWILAAVAALLLAALAAGSGPSPSRAASSDTAIFAGGCFWCMEAAFDEVDGVTETISGYAGGTKPNPNYGDHEGYVEAVKVTYDPAKVNWLWPCTVNAPNSPRASLVSWSNVREPERGPCLMSQLAKLP